MRMKRKKSYLLPFLLCFVLFSAHQPITKSLTVAEKWAYCSEEVRPLNENFITTMCVSELHYDFGKTTPGLLEHAIEVYNNGHCTLQISTIKGNAGDNVASYPKSISVGDTAILKFKWNAKNNSGRLNRTWVMYSNTCPEKTKFTINATLPR